MGDDCINISYININLQIDPLCSSAIRMIQNGHCSQCHHLITPNPYAIICHLIFQSLCDTNGNIMNIDHHQSIHQAIIHQHHQLLNHKSKVDTNHHQ